MKISEIKLPPIVGITGCARSGKDTFCRLSAEVFKKEKDKNIVRAGFADAVKGDLHQLLVKNVGISAYTNVDEEKELIRPLLVEYGTNLKRRLNPNCWIERMQPNLDLAKHLNSTLMITDVRYENEIDFIEEKGGVIVYIDMKGNKPANSEEEKNDEMLRNRAKETLVWDKVGADHSDLIKLKPKVSAILKKLSCTPIKKT
jgi:predicted AAA+ superfamily ATPase